MALTLSTQRASTSFLSNESAPRWRYDVFLSFRGADTREGFVSHLYHELCKCQGITTFFDDQELERGTSIPPELLSAIKASHTAIVVLSPNYASSKWCLDELRNIVECMEARKSILPVFYETNPSDIGNQRASFAKAFAEHEEKFISTEDEKKVTQWRADLKKVSKISGWHSKNFKSERQLIDDIVKCVWRKVQATFTLLHSPQKLVGTDSALEQLSLLLAHDANDVRFIGITGMGGVGKTTLAKLVYDKIFHHFEVHCFLENVREVSVRKRTLVRLQKQLLFPILKENIEKVSDQQRGIIYTKKCFCNKKVLLVLDDVDQIKQLQALAGKEDWFGMGSRIIITTRNERLLVEHDITLCHNVKVLEDAEALKLFSLQAFRKDQPEKDFLELSKYFVNHAGGLPLALQILGSALFKRGLDAWCSERHNLSKIPKPEIFDRLKISYDGLEEMQKSIFLDVACFHKGKYTEQVIEILDNSNSFGISSRIVIDVLIEKSILYQGHNNCIWMHDLIQEMARKIVDDESKEPGLRSRLWRYEDIERVFTANTGTGAIEAISLYLPKVEEVRQWNWEAFSKLHELRILEFDNLIFSSCPEFLPCSLRIMNWSFYPSKFLPTNFQPRFLTQLKMRGSKLVRLWEGKMDLPNLKYIDLSNSNKLMSTPNFSGLPNLETLELMFCENLVEIHPSVAVLKRLKSLCLDGCESIKSLPSEFEMDSLEVLSLYFCMNLKKIPEFGEQMKTLEQLDVSGSAIEEIPSSIGHLVGLEVLGLFFCKNLKKIPEFGEQMKNLRSINLRGSAIEEIPSSIGHLVGLKDLDLLDCKNLLNFPMAIRSLKSLERLCYSGPDKSRPNPPHLGMVFSSLNRLCPLRELSLRDCELYEGDIPDDIGCLSFLEVLNLCENNFVSLPESIRCLSKLWRLDLNGCKSLQELPPLPSERYLQVNVRNCTSLKRLLDPSKMMSRYTCTDGTCTDGENLFCYDFICLNNIAMAQDEGCINTILSTILKSANAFDFHPREAEIVIPGSEILGWFSNQSVGHSVNVDLPPPSCTDWLGIAFCVVFQEPPAPPPAPPHYHMFDIVADFCADRVCYGIGSLMSEHLWVFYLDRSRCRHREQFLFKTYFGGFTFSGLQWIEVKAELNTVKKCGARLLYKQDLEELNRTLKILKRTREYRDEAAPIGPGSPSFNDTEQIRKRHSY